MSTTTRFAKPTSLKFLPGNFSKEISSGNFSEGGKRGSKKIPLLLFSSQKHSFFNNNASSEEQRPFDREKRQQT
jgi:hypothetical protein